VGFGLNERDLILNHKIDRPMMTENPEQKLPDNALEAILNHGLEGLPQALSILINKATKQLDDQIQAWRTRPIGKISHLVVDPMDEDVRYDISVSKNAASPSQNPSPAMPTKDSKPRSKPSFHPAPGNVANSTSSKTPRPTSPSSPCAFPSPPTSAPFQRPQP
jgi:hypothetical protein